MKFGLITFAFLFLICFASSVFASDSLERGEAVDSVHPLPVTPWNSIQAPDARSATTILAVVISIMAFYLLEVFMGFHK
jgi:hypothetical protein